MTLTLATLLTKLHDDTARRIAATEDVAVALDASGRDVVHVGVGAVSVATPGEGAVWKRTSASTWSWIEPDIGDVLVMGHAFSLDQARDLGCPAHLLYVVTA